MKASRVSNEHCKYDAALENLENTKFPDWIEPSTQSYARSILKIATKQIREHGIDFYGQQQYKNLEAVNSFMASGHLDLKKVWDRPRGWVHEEVPHMGQVRLYQMIAVSLVPFNSEYPTKRKFDEKKEKIQKKISELSELIADFDHACDPEPFIYSKLKSDLRGLCGHDEKTKSIKDDLALYLSSVEYSLHMISHGYRETPYDSVSFSAQTGGAKAEKIYFIRELCSWMLAITKYKYLDDIAKISEAIFNVGVSDGDVSETAAGVRPKVASIQCVPKAFSQMYLNEGASKGFRGSWRAPGYLRLQRVVDAATRAQRDV